MENKYFLYRHIRLDKDEPFYIGIGTKSPSKLYNKVFRRAFEKKRRNKFWFYITNKTEYDIEILLESDAYSFIKQKEIEFIKLYGRKDLGLGTLVNLTDGGEGICGYKHSPDRIKSLRITSSGGNNPNSKKCIHFETSLQFDSLKEGCNFFNLNYGSQASAISKKNSTAKFYFENNYFERPTKESIGYKLSLLRKNNPNNRNQHHNNLIIKNK